MAEIVLGLEIDSKQTEADLASSLKKAGTKAGDGFSKSFLSSLTDIGRLSTGTGLGILAADLVQSTLRTLKNFAKDGVIAFQEAESSSKVFTAALYGTRAGSFAAMESIKQLADELELVAGIDDKLVLRNAALIQSFANLDAKGLQRAIKGAADLAAGTQKSFEEASDIIAKTASGGVEAFNKAFKKYGVVIDENTSKSQAFEIAMTAIESRFSGRATANISDYDKRVNELGSSYESLSESIGKAITSSELFKGVLESTSGAMKIATDIIAPGNAIASYEKILKSLREEFAKIAKDGNLSKMAKEDVANMNALSLKIGEVTAKLAKLKEGRDAQGVSSTAPQGPTPADRSAALGRLGTVGLSDMQQADFQKNQQLAQLNREQEFISLLEFNTRKEEIERQHQLNIRSIAESARVQHEAVDKDNNAKKLQRAQSINNALNQSLAKSTAMGIEALTKSLILGQKGFENFGKAMAGMLGDMASQLGMTLILSGLGIEALKSLGGSAAIAAGAGLVALGTILKSFSGGASAGAGDAIGGPNSFTPAATELPENLAEQEQRQPETKVVVNVHGDVFDTNETGLRIANILKEASLNNNVKVFA